MKFGMLTFDVEEFDIPLEYGLQISEQEMFDRTYNGLIIALSLINELNIKATFFVTARFASRFPEIIRNIAETHEIASHGYAHSHNYSEMNEQQCLAYVQKARDELEHISKKKITGFRAPRTFFKHYHILEQLGFKYDSSLHPTYVPGRYNNLCKPRKLHKIGKLTEIPISVTPLIRLPFSWLWFRNLGIHYAKACTMASMMGSNYTMIYFHPWEFMQLSDLKLPFYIKNRTGNKLYKSLEEYLRWCMSKGIKFITVNDYYLLNK